MTAPQHPLTVEVRHSGPNPSLGSRYACPLFENVAKDRLTLFHISVDQCLYFLHC